MGFSYRPLKNQDTLYDTATQIIVQHLREELQKRQTASLLLCGGTTPGPIYRSLSTISMPWKHITVGQVDERWVDASDPGSNAGLIQRTLLNYSAKPANFVPMKTDDATAISGQPRVESVYSNLVTINSMAVLGMGTDGHIGAWFPDAEGLSAATDPRNKNHVQAVTAKQSEVTGEYLERMTLTLSALSKCKSLLLLITGEEKRTVIERAFDSSNTDFPVSHLIRMVAASGDTSRLTILHAP